MFNLRKVKYPVECPEEEIPKYTMRERDIPRFLYIYFLHFITEGIYVEFFSERYAIHFIYVCERVIYTYISSYRTNVS